MKPVLLSIALLCWLPTLAAVPLGSDLAGMLAYAREHSQELMAIRHEADAAAARIEPAGALPDPVLRTELMDITNQGTNRPASLWPASVGATRYLVMQSLPWAGRRDLQRAAAEARYSQASNASLVSWADLSAKIKAAYARYVYLSASENLERDTLKLLQNMEKISTVRYAHGLGAQQDTVRIMLEQTGQRGELLKLENEKHHLLLQLNALLSRPMNAELAAPQGYRTLPATLDHPALERALQSRNPQLQLAAASLAESEQNRQLAYQNRLPGVTLGIAPTQSGNQVKSWDLMVEFNLPLQQETRRHQEREAEALHAAAQSRHEALATQLQAALAEAVSALETARRTEALVVESLLPQAELGYRSARAAYEAGRVDFPTLLEAQRQILKARQQQLALQLEQQLKFGEIEQMIGGEL